ncbi:MAG: Gfo/Idh/MocA family oxidoreductase [Deltaproteobacteria bacterium]|nr:Gfo/Idh/MocA family oxidoreductase [Deltaproteobacteria bacterium]
MKKNFAMIGAAGFVAPRHMQAIHALGHSLKAACDPYDGVGVLDRYFPECRFFTEVERFDRYLEKSRREGPESQIHYLSVCTPNYLHDAHCRLALRAGAHAICEKPLVISPWNLDQLAVLEREHERRVYTVLQLRLHDAVRDLKARMDALPEGQRLQVDLSYITRRGPWYHHSWKGDAHKSGTLALNIGVHFFDMLLWIFGAPREQAVFVREHTRVGGFMALARADVRWFLSIEYGDLPESSRAKGQHAYRALTLSGERFDFSTGFDDLHTKVYEDLLSGGGFGLDEARPAIEAVHQMRGLPVSPLDERAHPLLRGAPPAERA